MCYVHEFRTVGGPLNREDARTVITDHGAARTYSRDETSRFFPARSDTTHGGPGLASQWGLTRTRSLEARMPLGVRARAPLASIVRRVAARGADGVLVLAFDAVRRQYAREAGQVAVAFEGADAEKLTVVTPRTRGFSARDA